MTDLEWPPTPVDDMAIERKPKVCRHEWIVNRHWNGGPTSEPPITQCVRCNKVRDDVAARRGKSARRLGGDQERRIEKVYGPTKIGQRGDAVDHIGRVWRWQSKATRALPPRWLAAIDEPEWMALVPAWVVAPYYGMDGLYARKSVVIRSFVSRGIRTRDWLIVSALDGTVELGLPGPDHNDPRGGWWVIPGDWWLDHFGRDEGGNPS